MKKLPQLLLYAVLAASALPVFADIEVTPDAIRVDPQVLEPRLDISVEMPRGFIMTEDGDMSRSFKIHLPLAFDTLEHLSPSISGNRGTMSLYDWDYRGKQALSCGNIYQMSDARNKTDIEDLPSMSHCFLSSAGASSSAKSPALKTGKAAGGLSILASLAPNCLVIEDGDTCINLTELIPALIKSAQELQEIVASQQEAVEKIKETIHSAKEKANSVGKIESCSPNPATTEVSVKFTLTDDNIKASLAFVDINGMCRHETALGRAGVITVNVSSLPRGVYHVAMRCNGTVADTYRLILK